MADVVADVSHYWLTGGTRQWFLNIGELQKKLKQITHAQIALVLILTHAKFQEKNIPTVFANTENKY